MTDIVNEDVLDTDEPELTEYTSESDGTVAGEPKRARQVSTPGAGCGRRQQGNARDRMVPGAAEG